MSRAPIADAIEELVRVYQASLLLSVPSGIDYGKDSISHGEGGHGSHKPRSTPSHGQDPPISVWLEEQVVRLSTVARRRLELETGATGRTAYDTRGKARKAEDAAILGEVGRDATEVAYLYGRTERAVMELRKRGGKNPQTGDPLTREERPLTAPARETLNAHLNATTTTED